ncbi:MAG: envelope stress response membrane protein PspB [Gammaproteobacteria bacterium]|nr:envelope stress response membrane protein PspB [Gammaproteobacteria bacterium]
MNLGVVELLNNLTILPILFLIFVAPLWLFLHYRSKRQVSQGLSYEQVEQLTVLSGQADTMAKRISVLELLLDHEAPHWRERS